MTDPINHVAFFNSKRIAWYTSVVDRQAAEVATERVAEAAAVAALIENPVRATARRDTGHSAIRMAIPPQHHHGAR